MKSWIFFEKKVKSKKNDKVFSVSCQGEHKPRKRWKDSRFGHEFIIAGIAIGGRAPCPPPPCYAYVVYTQILWTKFWSICTVITLYIMHIRTNKNAHEKEHTFSRRRKNKKQNGQKRILCKFAFSK